MCYLIREMAATSGLVCQNPVRDRQAANSPVMSLVSLTVPMLRPTLLWGLQRRVRLRLSCQLVLQLARLMLGKQADNM